MLHSRLLSVICRLLAIAVFSSPALAQRAADRVQIGRDIVIQRAEQGGNLVCLACSIYLRGGQVAGDAVAVAGKVVLEQGAAIAGDVAAIAGDVRLQGGSQVAGDAVAVAGTVYRDSQSQVAGDVVSLGGPGWTLLFLLLPLLFLGAIVALVIWLIQRSRRSRTTVAAASPGGTTRSFS
ncbi:MAG TPA: hypothetical protein VEK33_22730 [Terriglobales bacterium]|nr:hypothetical protein [Terriglobales bacterium]